MSYPREHGYGLQSLSRLLQLSLVGWLFCYQYQAIRLTLCSLVQILWWNLLSGAHPDKSLCITIPLALGRHMSLVRQLQRHRAEASAFPQSFLPGIYNLCLSPKVAGHTKDERHEQCRRTTPPHIRLSKRRLLISGRARGHGRRRCANPIHTPVPPRPNPTASSSITNQPPAAKQNKNP